MKKYGIKIHYKIETNNDIDGVRKIRTKDFRETTSWTRKSSRYYETMSYQINNVLHVPREPYPYCTQPIENWV